VLRSDTIDPKGTKRLEAEAFVAQVLRARRALHRAPNLASIIRVPLPTARVFIRFEETALAKGVTSPSSRGGMGLIVYLCISNLLGFDLKGADIQLMTNIGVRSVNNAKDVTARLLKRGGTKGDHDSSQLVGLTNQTFYLKTDHDLEVKFTLHDIPSHYPAIQIKAITMQSADPGTYVRSCICFIYQPSHRYVTLIHLCIHACMQRPPTFSFTSPPSSPPPPSATPGPPPAT
jgi:hypothetical protein